MDEQYSIDLMAMMPVMVALGDGKITPRKAMECLEAWMEGADFRAPKAQTWGDGQEEACLSNMMIALRGVSHNNITKHISALRGTDAEGRACASVIFQVQELVMEDEEFDWTASVNYLTNHSS